MVYGIQSSYIDMFKSLYHNNKYCARNINGNTILFDIVIGVRQGCVISPFLFLLVIDFILKNQAND